MQYSLPSWNNTLPRQAILDFIAAVNDESNAAYVAPAERVAVFDHDGTLCCEQPMYGQLDFLLRKLAAQAASDPLLRMRQPWQAAYEQDVAWFRDAITSYYQGDNRAIQILLSGILPLFDNQHVDQIEAEAAAFVMHTRHPMLDRPYSACVFQPMRELLQLLEAHDFTNYLVSGSSRDFIRSFSWQFYGIPRERVIGSAATYRYVEDDDGGAIVQQAAIDTHVDGADKPVQIWHVVGRRPILAVGNSNGDVPMLRFAGGPSRPALRLVIHHDDAEREFAYTTGAEQALAVAEASDWTVVRMRQDWTTVFVPEQHATF